MIQELHIKIVLNGWIVTAGCQTLVFNDPNEFAIRFHEWLLDPDKTEAPYRKLMQERKLTPAVVDAEQPAQEEVRRPIAPPPQAVPPPDGGTPVTQPANSLIGRASIGQSTGSLRG